jgi:threonine dehydratase
MRQSNHFAITANDIRAASQRIAGQVVRTPLILCDSISKSLGCELLFKAENLQHEGSFKIRGATNAVSSLVDQTSKNELAECGVITHSSGNHAAALARAATLNGIRAKIVMPHNSSRRKFDAVRQYGIEPILCEPSSEARQLKADEIILQTDAKMIHAYDHPDIIAGQGTVGLEILEQITNADVILAPVGGGGLLAGILLAVKTADPNIQIFGCEPTFADDAHRSLHAGTLQKPTRYDSVADGLRTCLGDLTFPIIQNFVDDILLVDEPEILEATRTIAIQGRLVAEPSGAVTFAAACRYRQKFKEQRVVAVISGGNLDMGGCTLGNTR